MKKAMIVALPQEVEQIAQNVSVEKRTEVQTVLNQVFEGVSKMREQLDSVEVKDEGDVRGMKQAGAIRLEVKRVRLDAEKVFDAKRAEVQQKMLGFKTEDQLWLKAKQTMQILTKEIEENAKWKEDTKKRHEAEQLELRTQQREFAIAKLGAEIPRSDFEAMSDDAFAIFYQGLVEQNNRRIEEEQRAEAERLAKEAHERAERERLEAENRRLREEAQERARKEAEEQSRIRMEEEAKRKAEARLAAAPDKEKLEKLAFVFESIPMPLLSTAEGQDLIRKVVILQGKIVDFIKTNSENL